MVCVPHAISVFVPNYLFLCIRIVLVPLGSEISNLVCAVGKRCNHRLILFTLRRILTERKIIVAWSQEPELTRLLAGHMN
jgi:hypothetical protein